MFNIFGDSDAFYELFEAYHNIEKQQFQITGNIGEFILDECLSNICFPGYSKFISDILLPAGKEKTQIDSVFISKKAIICIEFKNLGGWIFGSENQKQWTQCFRNRDKYYFYNPVLQNKVHCNALAKVLRTVPDNIVSLIVFSNRCELKKINCPHIDVIRIDELQGFLHKFDQEHEDRFTDKNVDAVYELLKLYKPTKEEMKEHIERVRKFTEGLECPRCGSSLKLDHRKLRDGKTLYFFECTNPKCKFERDGTFAEVIKYGNEEDRKWAYEHLQ